MNFLEGTLFESSTPGFSPGLVAGLDGPLISLLAPTGKLAIDMLTFPVFAARKNITA
jgi:hypothetical protein